MLLQTIPPMKAIRAYLKKQQSISMPGLRSWTNRISPAAFGILRWIIASNRSFIVQVESCPGQEGTDLASSRSEDRVTNMEGWVQFRFAQGSPDKELRFREALNNTKGVHNRFFPTLFAWHGSSLSNWHSIIRHGLDYKDRLNGRAYGDGCYHSMDCHTCIGYSKAGNQSTIQVGVNLLHSSIYA